MEEQIWKNNVYGTDLCYNHKLMLRIFLFTLIKALRKLLNIEIKEVLTNKKMPINFLKVCWSLKSIDLKIHTQRFISVGILEPKSTLFLINNEGLK